MAGVVAPPGDVQSANVQSWRTGTFSENQPRFIAVSIGVMPKEPTTNMKSIKIKYGKDNYT